MKPNAIIVFAHEGDMFFRSIEHQGEYIKNFFLGSSNEKTHDNDGVIMAGTYRKNGNLYTTIVFEGGSFDELLHYNNVAWATFLNYGILFEFEGSRIKMSFFRDEERAENAYSLSQPDKKIWVRYSKC